MGTSSGKTVNIPALVSCFVLAAVPLVYLISLVIRYGVDVPILDQWELVPMLNKSYHGELTLSDLWAQHNEHRPLFPFAIMIALARLTHWNTNWELAVTLLLAVGIFAFLFSQMNLTGLRSARTGVNWLIPFVALLIFSPSQMENWLWGWQIQMVLNTLAVTAGIVLLGHPEWSWQRFAGALFLGVVAMYSFANGVLYWVIGLPMIFLIPRPNARTRNLAFVLWLVIGGLTIASYLYRFERFAGYAPLNLALKYPIEYVKYIFAYLGAACTGLVDENPAVTGLIPGQLDILPVSAVGLAGVVLWVASIRLILRWRCARFDALVPYIALSVYAVGSGMLTGLARLGLGVHQSLSSRYVTVSSLFWVSLLVFLYTLATRIRAVEQSPEQRPLGAKRAGRIRLSAWALILVIACLVIANAGHGLRFAQGRYESSSESVKLLIVLEEGDAALAGLSYEVYASVYPEPDVVEKRLEVLREHRLSFLRKR